MATTWQSTIDATYAKLSNEGKALWDKLGGNPFGEPFELPTVAIDSNLPSCSGYPVVPIHWLRGDSSFAPDHQPEHRVFRSSGTTSSARSVSRFSKDGLLLYKLASLSTFAAVKELVAPQSSQLVSLVPPVEEWPDSSLAQMIEWFGECWPLTYTNVEELEFVIGGDPVIVIGTGFHFVQWLDLGKKISLPGGSLIFETGGTKGKSRSVTKEELYGELKSGFGVSEKDILSEYGMCELASQAYEWTTEDGSRSFRFPNWCRVFVQRDPKTLSIDEEGSFSLYDPIRVDLPTVLVTEDRINLDQDSFRLLGRHKFAPLKGCSLNAETTVPKPTENNSTPVFSKKISPESPERRLDLLKSIASRSVCIDLLAIESGSTNNAKELWQEWQEEIEQIEFPKQQGSGRRTLIISPSNHSLAALKPLIKEFMCGSDVAVRVPENLPLLDYFVSELSGVTKLDRNFRVDEETHNYFDRLIAFGETTTINYLRQVFDGDFHGFGTEHCVGLVDYNDLHNSAGDIARAAFSLGQKGCLNLRGLVVVGSNDKFTKVSKILTNAFDKYWQSELDIDSVCYLNRWQYDHRFWQRPHFRDSSSSPLFRLDPSFSTNELIEAPFSLSISFVPAVDDGLKIFSDPTVTRIATATALSDLPKTFSLTNWSKPDLS